MGEHDRNINNDQNESSNESTITEQVVRFTEIRQDSDMESVD